MMTVSLCVVAYNEEQFLPNLLTDLENQTKQLASYGYLVEARCPA